MMHSIPKFITDPTSSSQASYANTETNVKV